jgi:hypothetical protein
MNTKTLSVLLAAAVLTACVTTAPVERRPRPRPPAPAPAPEPVNLAKVYFYPNQGQSPDQQNRDQYECHVWAVKQTGFDPTQHNMSVDSYPVVAPAQTPGQSVAAGAIVGAVIGAAVAGPHDTGKGAVLGAMAGSVAGSAAAANAQAEADAANAAAARRGGARYEREAAEYRRAMTACLMGRGYTVR